MDAAKPGRVLRHGTTRKRAEAILRDGPDPNFVEPGSLYKAEAFSAAPAEGLFPVGSPELYAELKAKNFPDEGGRRFLKLSSPTRSWSWQTIQGANSGFGP